MADVTGPIHTLPGARHAVPEGTMCDFHPRRKAVARIQGETDSFGSEMWDLCGQCEKSFKKDRKAAYCGQCDYCHKDVTDLRPVRDHEEGMCGPVYYICGECHKKKREMEEEEYGCDAEDWMYDD